MIDAAVESEVLDELLCIWHEWQTHAATSRGFASRALVIGEYSAGRHHDADNGVLDSELDKRRAKAVDFAVTQQMVEPFRSAVYVDARYIATGANVWSSPRLPQDKQERADLIEEARGMLIRLLRSAGVL